MTLDYARALAEALVDLLRPACQRIEIAGSIRRGKARPNDIEIVAIPALAAFTRATLFGGLQGGSTSDPVNLLNEKCDELLTTGALEKRPDSQGRYCWGTGVKRAIFFQGKDYAPVDLFQVIEPAQWGVIYAIRTGPGDFNHLLVTNRRFGGACPLHRKVAGGRVWDLSQCTPAQARHYAGMVATKFASLAESAVLPVSMVPTPEEEDFLAVLGVPCWLPEQRTEQRLMKFINK